MRSLFLHWFPYPSDAASSWFQEEDDGASIIREDTFDPVRYSLTLRYTITTNRS